MPRKPSWPPKIYTRGKCDYVRLRLGVGSFSEIRLGLSGSDEAKQEYARILAEWTQRGGPPRQEPTFAEVAAAWLAEQDSYLDESSRARVRKALQLSLPLYGASKAKDFKALALRTCREQFVKQGWCRRLCNQSAHILRRIIKWGVGREMVPTETLVSLQAVEDLQSNRTKAIDHPKIKPVSKEDVEKTLPHLSRIVRAMVQMQLYTGMRACEVCVIRPMDIRKDWLKVGEVSVWLYKLGKHKTHWKGGERDIPIGPKGQEILASFLEREAESFCFSPREALLESIQARGGKSLGDRKSRKVGVRWKTQAYDRAVRRACRKAGVSWTPNQLRHTVGTQVETDYSREDARCVLGHTNTKTTAIYAESVERAARVIAKIG